MDIQKIFEERFIDREIIPDIMKWIDDKEMVLLLGARQTGKTSILYKIILELVSSGKADKGDIIFFDAENVNEATMLSRGHEEILKFVNPEKNRRKYLFIDEIHYVKNIDRTLKLLVDHYGGSIKILATGSSSIEIKNRFRESMAGRKIIFEVHPLTFREFLDFSGNRPLLKVISGVDTMKESVNASAEHMRQMSSEYLKYLVYGGYPRVVLERDDEKKKKILEEIYNAYIRKDVSYFFRIDDIDRFNAFIKYVALNSGQIFNKNSASRELGIAVKTLDRYVNILKLTYVLGVIRPFYSNKTKEILKMPKMYFNDIGIRNFITGNFRDIDSREDAGAVIETGVYMNLIKRAGNRENIKFWRAKTGGEVDFIIEGRGPEAFECKKSSSSFSRARYAEFINKYKPSAFYVMSFDREEHGGIIYKPFYYM